MATDPTPAVAADDSPAPESADPGTSEPFAEPSTVEPSGPSRPHWAFAALGVLIVLVLGALTRFLEQSVPEWAAGSALADVAAAVEYPVYAIALGLLGGLVISLTRLRDKVSGGFRTEFFIKTGLVLLGASINLSVIARAAGPAIAQALIVVPLVFFFTWWLAGRLGLDEKLRALVSSAVSICGVSAAITAAGAVRARREQLAYTASLVILFALPSIFLLPWLADVFGLSAPVAGAWIGGNIDTTAAVAAAGAIVGEEALQIAAVVKSTQNVLMGLVAVALTAYFTFRVERAPGAKRPGLGALWTRFPKFALGFLLASVVATWYLDVAGESGAAQIGVVTDLRTWFLILAFVSIGLEFRLARLREAGWRPIAVFGGAAVFNLAVALLVASILFRGFEV
ncbi:YeiH family protein [Glycomyces paridis]|uniref:Putative sulfate exporter family transporter n=1 Tax=Glycomyces paridis TaxID=2126555 RepID=A0A4S8P2D7_9ACTN|nr:putative sulfate exporter family transporter [Glycomyces paridis]THV24250.1 putative sulfate exporter family transporter [Glycomyces paridis]